MLNRLIIFSFLSAASLTHGLEKPRIGIEAETARHYPGGGQIIEIPDKSQWKQLSKRIMEYWQTVYGGRVLEWKERDTWWLERPEGKTGYFWVAREWASDLAGSDGFELVNPPFEPQEIDQFNSHYDEFLHTVSVGAGLKTSLQFNLELRDLISGFSLKEKPTDKLGIPFNEIQDANISPVVDLFLWLETHLLNIYAAFAPKRLGNLVNYFAVPMIFEQPELLKELAAMPKERRTYRNVRAVFLKYNAQEIELSKYAERGDTSARTPWKYRPFNMRKIFMLQENNPTWIYPAVEIRIPDTPADGAELKKITDLAYALYETGSQSTITPEMISSSYQDYRDFLATYRHIVPFRRSMRIINQDLVAQSLTPEFADDYKKFMKSLKLDVKRYPPFAGAEPSAFVSQTYDVYKLIGKPKAYNYMGRTVTIPEVTIPWDLTGFSSGMEFEFSDPSGTIAPSLKNIPFLEEKITTESASGNREAITKPTSNLIEAFLQIQYMRDVLGDNLKSIHKHDRIPKSFYQKVPKQKFDSWIARIGDWIMTLRVTHRQPKFTFWGRTQNRMQVDTPNGWVADDKFEYRGTMRMLMIGDSIDIETRGLMNGVYKTTGLEPDLFIVSALLMLKGIHEPYLIEGDYLHRIVNEVRDPSSSFPAFMEQYAATMGTSLAQAQIVHRPEDLLGAMRLPNLMLLPLQGFEFNPLFSGHDIKRMNHAMTNWKREVWDIMRDRSIDLAGAREKFLESLKNWAQSSRIEDTLFDSLLVVPEPGSKWTEMHLPTPNMQVAFMNKLLELQNSEFSKAGIEMFLIIWTRKDSKSFVEAALAMSEGQRQRLGQIILAHETPQRAGTLLKKLKVEKLVPETPSGMLTNMRALANRWLGAQPHPEPSPRRSPEPPIAVVAAVPEPSAADSRQPAEDGLESRISHFLAHSSPTPQEALKAIHTAYFKTRRPSVTPARVLEVALGAADRLSGMNQSQLKEQDWDLVFDLAWRTQPDPIGAFATVLKKVWFFPLGEVERSATARWAGGEAVIIKSLTKYVREHAVQGLPFPLEGPRLGLTSFLLNAVVFGASKSGMKESLEALQSFSSREEYLTQLTKLGDMYTEFQPCASWGEVPGELAERFGKIIDSAKLSQAEREKVLAGPLERLGAHYMELLRKRELHKREKHLRAMRLLVTRPFLERYPQIKKDFDGFGISLAHVPAQSACETTLR